MKIVPMPPKKPVEVVEDEYSADNLLKDALTKKLSSVIILGENEQGVFASCSSIDTASIIFMLEAFKFGLLAGEF